jgi:hypothetical protein
MCQEKAAERRAAGLDAVRGEPAAQLVEREVGMLDHQGNDRSAWAVSGERFQPPYRSGATLPQRCQRCISLTTKLTLTSNFAAVARQDAPASTERTTRSRSSTEYGRVIHRWPPRPSDQLESQQPHVVNPKSIPSTQEPL